MEGLERSHTTTNPTAAAIIIGDEILSGRTVDTNIAYLAKMLERNGVVLKEVRIIADDIEAIVAAVNSLRCQHNYLFTTGGIGPTHDDKTTQAIAQAFNKPLDINPQARQLLEDHYDSSLNSARLKMVCLPEGAELIANPVSQAPGFRVDNVYVLAGVPAIMQAMLDGIEGRLAGGPKIFSRQVLSSLPEGDIADRLASIQQTYQNVAIGSYPSFQRLDIEVRIVLRSSDKIALKQACRQVEDTLTDLDGRLARGQ